MKYTKDKDHHLWQGHSLYLLGAVLEVHHGEDFLLVRHVHRRDRDVADDPELAAVVQMLVLKPKKVPDEPVIGNQELVKPANPPSEDLAYLLDTGDQLRRNGSDLDKVKGVKEQYEPS